MSSTLPSPVVVGINHANYGTKHSRNPNPRKAVPLRVGHEVTLCRSRIEEDKESRKRTGKPAYAYTPKKPARRRKNS